MDIQVTLLGDGALIGITYFPKGDREQGFEDEDWTELNVYLGIIKLTWRFF